MTREPARGVAAATTTASERKQKGEEEKKKKKKKCSPFPKIIIRIERVSGQATWGRGREEKHAKKKKKKPQREFGMERKGKKLIIQGFLLKMQCD